MLIGAHVAARGGIHAAVDNGLAVGAEVIQTHPTPAQMWRPLHLEEVDRELYLAKYAASGLRGHYLHAVYLINLASPKETLLRSSVSSLVHYLEVAASLDADGVVFHPGSHLGAGFDSVLPQLAAAIREVIERSPPGRARLLVENSAGSGGCVGRSFEEVARIVEATASDRVGVCLDTQHAFASGYDLRDPSGVARTLDEFGRLIGFERLGLVHANDSARALGSNADRHANIGEGEIGAAGFRLLLGDPRMRRVPWVLEVPGPERKGPDIGQVGLLRELAGGQPPGGEGSGGSAGGSSVGAVGGRGPQPPGGSGADATEPPDGGGAPVQPPPGGAVGTPA
ncbi:MAG: deoxyribonuclease IV [Candidatus Dormibacteria bacterium]